MLSLLKHFYFIEASIIQRKSFKSTEKVQGSLNLIDDLKNKFIK